MRISDWSSDVCSSDLARDAVAFGDVLGGDSHVELAERIVKDAVHVVDHRGVAEACAPTCGRHDERTPAHRFGAAADCQIGIAEPDRLPGGDTRLQAGTAAPVDGI